MRVSRKIEGNSVLDHGLVVAAHQIEDPLASGFSRTNQGIVSHSNHEQTSLLANLQLFLEGLKRIIVVSHLVGHHIGIEGYYIGICKPESCCQIQADVIDQKSRVEKDLIVVGVVLVVARGDQKGYFANDRFGHC